MVQPIRPQDASSVYRQQAASGTRSGSGVTPGGGDVRGTDGARQGRRTDRVQVSEEGRQLRRVLDAMATLPDVREERIAFLQQQIENGTYDRGLAEVAQRLVENGFRL